MVNNSGTIRTSYRAVGNANLDSRWRIVVLDGEGLFDEKVDIGE
jgi:hypothetical protein